MGNMRLAKRLFLILFLIVAIVFASEAIFYRSVPLSNTARTRFDVIIVLGYPANADGTPSPEQRARVLEGVQEYRRGVAPRMIVTGGPAHNHYVEADVMAAFARSQGLPSDSVIEEARAQDTIQNAYYSAAIMKSHGWTSAEVVSSWTHLPRASLIFSHFPIEYRMHSARVFSGPQFLYTCATFFYEARRTCNLRYSGFKPSPYLPQ